MDVNKELSAYVVNKLKFYGIKYQNGERRNIEQGKSCRKTLFGTPLSLLELADVILANGKVVRIPRFVADACNRILEQVETEGLFRKAGSLARQKEIRLNLEEGKSLGKNHHIIDVANVLKFFFRELPEPLIAPNIQETFLQSFSKKENYVKALLLSCLLLPPITINTLSFFMQFLYTVSLSQHFNKMCIENLAIIFTPGVMPYPNLNSHRFSNHVKIISVLIKNANDIGILQQGIETKMRESSFLSAIALSDRDDPLTECGLNTSLQNETKGPSSRKKRRSDMFNGLKRIVGTAIGNFESIDHPSSDSKDSYNTPLTKEIKKRKINDAMCEFNSKNKNSKTNRLSFGGNRYIKNISFNPDVISMERRWSIGRSGWVKNNNQDIKHSGGKTIELRNSECGGDFINNIDANFTTSEFSVNQIPENNNIMENLDSSIKISKNKYKEIKITHISNELSSIPNTVIEGTILNNEVSGLDQVQTRYERMVVDTDELLSQKTKHLRERLCRGIKTRKISDQCLIGSPNARKIYTRLRRPQDKAPLSTISIQSTRNEPKTYVEVTNVPQRKGLKLNRFKSNVVSCKSVQINHS